MTINESADSSVSQNNTDTDILKSNTTPEVSQPSKQDDNKAATPSNAGEIDDKKTYLDVVKDAVEKTKSDPSTPKQNEETVKDPLETDASKDKEDKSKENTEEDTRFDKHPRFVKLNNEVKTLKSDLARLQPAAQEYEKIETYLKSQNLDHKEVSEGMMIMGLMKNDPVKAYHAIKPYHDALAQAAGVALSPELQRQVDEGMVDRNLASELQRTKILKSLAEEKAANLARSNQTQTETALSQERANQIGQSVTKWETGMFARDPDYAIKQKWIGDTCKALLNGRVPQNEDEAIRVCEMAHNIVTKRLVENQPKKAAVTPPLSSSASSASRGVIAKPTTLLEAAQAGLAMTNTT